MRDILFDWDEILKMQGNSGPYLQYTYARCQSILNKSNELITGTYQDIDIQASEEPIIKWLDRYPEVVEQAGLNFTPHIICTYLYELAQRFNSFYANNSILDSDRKTIRVAITQATPNVMRKVMHLL